MDSLPGIGHNEPPQELAELPSPEKLQDLLLQKHQKAIERARSLLDAFTRAPTNCTDDLIAGQLGDFKEQIRVCASTLDGLRISEKSRFDSLAKVAHGFFKKPMDDLDVIKGKINERITSYLRRKEDAARAAAAEAARLAREESDRKMQEAQALAQANMPKLADEAVSQAAATEKEAEKLEKRAEAKPAELTRTRGVEGSVSSLKKRWVGRIEDRNTLDLESLRAHFGADDLQKALNSFVRANCKDKESTPPTLNGAKIYQETYV